MNGYKLNNYSTNYYEQARVPLSAVSKNYGYSTRSNNFFILDHDDHNLGEV